jgi:hypothetical protein
MFSVVVFIEMSLTSGDLTLNLALLGFVVSTLALIVQSVRAGYMSRQLSQSSVIQAIVWMEKMRPSRKILYLRRESKKPSDPWTTEEEEAAREASRWFDVLGVLDSTGHIDHKFVDRFYAIPA